MDRFKGSYKSVIKVGMEMNYLSSKLSKKYRDFITSKPTSEAWFQHWQKDLEKRKVQIHFGGELQKLNFENNRIISAEVFDSKLQRMNRIIADTYVLSLPIEALAALVDRTPELQKGDLKKSKKLSDLALHIQLSFQLFFNRKISLGSYNSFLLIDSAWDLIVLSYDQAYKETKLSDKLPEIKGAWSVAACTAYMPGIVYKKPMNTCTYEEILVELWAQMNQSKALQALIEKNNDFSLSENFIVKWAPMWPTYSINNKGVLTTTEPKFTNNAGSYALRPSLKTPIKNLYLSTAYVKETIDIFSMEAAAFAGKSVAREIEPRSTFVYVKQRPPLFSFFRNFDSYLFQHHLPNLNPIIIVVLFLLILLLPIYLMANI